jgi:hypothetical protein
MQQQPGGGVAVSNTLARLQAGGKAEFLFVKGKQQ